MLRISKLGIYLVKYQAQKIVPGGDEMEDGDGGDVTVCTGTTK